MSCKTTLGIFWYNAKIWLMGRWWIELVQYNLLENFKMMRKLHSISRQNFEDGKDLCSFPVLTSTHCSPLPLLVYILKDIIYSQIVWVYSYPKYMIQPRGEGQASNIHNKWVRFYIWTWLSSFELHFTNLLNCI